jgi:hypothetical protein
LISDPVLAPSTQIAGPDCSKVPVCFPAERELTCTLPERSSISGPNGRAKNRYLAAGQLVLSGASWQPMASRHISQNSRTVVNQRPYPVRLVLSDGTERIAGPWGLILLPLFASDGSPLEVLLVELVFSQSQVEISDDAA